MNGVSGIPVSEIVSYCDFIGLHDPDERIDFLRIMKLVDDHNMKRRNKDG